VSSRISFCDCENKSGLSKASEIATKDSSLEIFHASLSLHVGQLHNSELPVTLLGLMQSHSWKKKFHTINEYRYTSTPPYTIIACTVSYFKIHLSTK